MNGVAAAVKKMAEEMSGHTPGPWVVKGGLEPDTLCVTDYESSYIVDRFKLGVHPAEQKQANARLIAAAPDMFELLLYIRNLIASDAPVAKRIDTVFERMGLARLLG